MRKGEVSFDFRSPLGELMEKFIKQKRAFGCRYNTESHTLHAFDRFLCNLGAVTMELPRPLVEAWTAKRPHEIHRTQKARIGIIRQFAIFMRQEGLNAFVPEARLASSVSRFDFTPYIFSRDQVRRILGAADQIRPNKWAPLRHRVMPEIFRLLYACGMRETEVLQLRVRDVNLEAGVVTVREGKFRKDRLVPLAPCMVRRLRAYIITLGDAAPGDVFLPARDGRPYRNVYYTFRQLLRQAGIPHGGRGKGPRLHDLRATFAVHRLEVWYQQGEDLGAKLPVLATYMGHQSLSGTQRYLRLTPNLFPDITSRLEASVGHVITGR
jgi:integrase